MLKCVLLYVCVWVHACVVCVGVGWGGEIMSMPPSFSAFQSHLLWVLVFYTVAHETSKGMSYRDGISKKECPCSLLCTRTSCANHPKGGQTGSVDAWLWLKSKLTQLVLSLLSLFPQQKSLRAHTCTQACPTAYPPPPPTPHTHTHIL